MAGWRPIFRAVVVVCDSLCVCVGGGGGGIREKCICTDHEKEHAYGSKGTPRLTRRVKNSSSNVSLIFCKAGSNYFSQKSEQNGTRCTYISYSSSSRSENTTKSAHLCPVTAISNCPCINKDGFFSGRDSLRHLFSDRIFSCHREFCNCSATNRAFYLKHTISICAGIGDNPVSTGCQEWMVN